MGKRREGKGLKRKVHSYNFNNKILNILVDSPPVDYSNKILNCNVPFVFNKTFEGLLLPEKFHFPPSLEHPVYSALIPMKSSILSFFAAYRNFITSELFRIGSFLL